MLEMWFPPSDPLRNPIQVHALYVFLLKIIRHLNNKNKIEQKQKKWNRAQNKQTGKNELQETN